MTLKLYGLKSCDTCRKALKQLEAAHLSPQFIDLRQMDHLSDKLPIWLAQDKSEALLNKRSTSWRQLDEAERAKPVETLLAAYPTLIKRPVIEAEERLFIGWSRAVQDALL